MKGQSISILIITFVIIILFSVVTFLLMNMTSVLGDTEGGKTVQ